MGVCQPGENQIKDDILMDEEDSQEPAASASSTPAANSNSTENQQETENHSVSKTIMPVNETDETSSGSSLYKEFANDTRAGGRAMPHGIQPISYLW